jgi:hypothetical protein
MTKCLKEASQHFTECASGVSAGDAHGHSYPSSSVSHSDIAKNYSGDYLADNGDRYNNGKLVEFRSTNGLSYTVRRPGPR